MGLAVLGSYELMEKIGDGATSVVHRGLDRFGRSVAVKEPLPGLAHDPEMRGRLRREAATMARVRSPFVAEAYDAVLAGDRPFIVTEYIPGVCLRDLVQWHGPLPGPALTAFAGCLARAVAAIHGAGVLHRDLKPGNVMVVDGRPKVIDFGIAHDAGIEQVTQPGVLVGTPGYLAPELIEGESASEGSDVFSWAATVAFAATGRPPYGTGSPHGVCFRVLRGAADLDGVPDPVRWLLRQALRREPVRRPRAGWLAARLAEARLTGH